MTIEERIERLERENRRWRRVAMYLMALLAASFVCTRLPSGLLAGAAEGNDSPGKVKATAFELVTQKGDLIAFLGGDEKGATLYLGGADAFAPKAYLSSRDNASALRLEGPDGFTVINQTSLSNFSEDPVKKRRREEWIKARIARGEDIQHKSREDEEFEKANSETHGIAHIGMTDQRGGEIDVCNTFGKVVVSAESSKTNQGLVIVNDVNGMISNALGPK
jgi:hypothetical protein